jgi:hypothetical protein
MSERNLSVEEILNEAEAVLASIGRQSEVAKEEIKSIDEPVEDESKTFTPKMEQEEVKTFTPKMEQEEVKPFTPGAEKAEEDVKAAPEVSEKTMIAPRVSDKTRPVKISEKTAVVPADLKKQKSFFKHNSNDVEYNSTPPQIIEKAATIKSKSRFDKTSDLEEIPTILAVDELDKTKVMLSSENRYEQPKEEPALPDEYGSMDQIKMIGFDDEFEDVPIIDEALAEKLLEERRAEKVKKFRLFAEEELEPSEKSELNKINEGDYTDKTERAQTLENLFKRKASAQIRASITAFIGIFLLALTVFKDTKYMPAFLNVSSVYLIAAVILYLGIIITNINIITNGFNFKKGINADFPVAAVSLFAMAHTIALIAVPDLLVDGAALYPSAATLGLFLGQMGKRAVLVRIIKNFEFLTDGADKSVVEDIVNDVDAAIISKNLLDGEPYLKYSVHTDFPTSFLEISFAQEPADKMAKIIAPVMFGLNALLFVLIGLINKSWGFAFNAAMAGLLLSCPVCALLATNNTLIAISNALADKGAMVCGYEGADYVHNSNALVMEASDLFGARSCDLHGIKTFNGTKIDDAILQTAAVIIKTKSPLAHVFDDVIVGKKSILPEVDSIIYEDKMGTSAWIYQKKVLVGSRDLLVRHGVAVPKIEYEEKYTRNGKRRALYLAIAGKISAMFIVSYSGEPQLRRTLKRLEKSGITVILRSCDPFVNEESIMDIFGLPEGFVRVMAASNGRIFEKYSDMAVEKSPAYAVHNSTAIGFISTVLGADKLVSAHKYISVLISFGCAIGFGMAALLAFINGLSHLGAMNIIIFQAIWGAFVLLVSGIRRNGV